ncbi:MAG: hypothetical protein ACI4NO_07015 [Oxalobacter sp.]
MLQPESMKKLLMASITAVMGISAHAADTGWRECYSTSRHYICVSCPEAGSQQCTYESWNKPRAIGQGSPDLSLKNGRHTLYPNGNSTYVFTTGNVKIEMFDELRGNSEDRLDIYINGRLKNHYRLYSHH